MLGTNNLMLFFQNGGHIPVQWPPQTLQEEFELPWTRAPALYFLRIGGAFCSHLQQTDCHLQYTATTDASFDLAVLQVATTGA